MMLAVQPAAIAELDEAVGYYEEQRPGLGLELLEAVADAVAFAAAHPDAGELRHAGDREARRFVVKRFPYVLYVAPIGARREVIAIAHAARGPSYWRERRR